MAFSFPIKLCIPAVPLLCFAVSCSLLGAAAAGYEVPEARSAGACSNDTSPEAEDPTKIVAKALLCFDEKYVYENCEQSYRLTEAGELGVPRNSTNEFCTGPCLNETNLVLSCVDGITANFKFFNNVTSQDIRDTVKAACGRGPERGNFNVTNHIEGNQSSVSKAAFGNSVQLPLGLMTLGCALLL